MSDIRKDHSIGAGTGAAAGAVTGATVGVVGGPIGMAAGAVVGGIIGAAAGDSIAEAVNPTDYQDHWKNNYTTTPYYASGREWNDYEPAYKLGYNGYGATVVAASKKSSPTSSATGKPAAVSRAWAGTKQRARYATVGTTSSARCRVMPTATVAKQHCH